VCGKLTLSPNLLSMVLTKQSKKMKNFKNKKFKSPPAYYAALLMWKSSVSPELLSIVLYYFVI
jgi:hypothetical protein